MHSKDELHQWDELKQNQRAHLEDLLEQHWSPRGDTFTPPGEGYSVAGEDTPRPGEAILFAPHWAHNSSRLHGTESHSENPENVGNSGGNKTISSVDNIGVEVMNKSAEGGNGLLLNNTEGKVNEGNRSRDKVTQTHSPLLEEDKSKLTKIHTSGISQLVTQNPDAKFSPTEETIREKAGSRFRPTKEPNPEPREQARRRENDTPEEERILRMEEAKLEEERKELLLLHKRLDQEKEILRQQQMKREEEARQREKGTDRRHHLHGKHHHLQTTTQKPGNRHFLILESDKSANINTCQTCHLFFLLSSFLYYVNSFLTETTTSTTTTQQPSAPAGPRPPARPHQTKRRMRKNRKRISKAAMRAMLM